MYEGLKQCTRVAWSEIIKFACTNENVDEKVHLVEWNAATDSGLSGILPCCYSPLCTCAPHTTPPQPSRNEREMSVV